MSQKMKWDEAQSYCRENHTDLVTIQSLDDMKMLSSIAGAGSVSILIWIGLRKYNVESWMWSSGDTPGLADYANWASLPNSSQNCGALTVDGKWLGVVCSTALPFVCQIGECQFFVSHNVVSDKNVITRLFSHVRPKTVTLGCCQG